MAKQVTWSPRALANYFKVLEYLKVKLGQKVADSFIDKTDKIISQISSESILFKKSNVNGAHEVLITKHNLLIYFVKSEEIEILNIYDTRQHPKKKLKK